MQKKQIDVLIVEDSPGDLRLTREMLREPGPYAFKTAHAASIKEALRKLGGGKFAVILLDMNLPDSSGLDGLERIAAAYPLVPVVVLTGRDDERVGVEALKRHASDYLAKGSINPFLLTRAIRYAIERKKSEEELRASEQRLKFHFENSPLAVVEWDADFVVTQWSKEAERVFGWKKEETLGRRIDRLGLIYPDDIPIVNHTMERLTSGEEALVVSSNRNVTRTGEVIECTWHNSVLLDKSGKMVSVTSLIQDITERRRAEEEREQLLLEVKQRALELDTVFKTLPYLVSLHGPDGRYLRVNPALTKLFGFDPTAEKREEAARRLNARYPDGTPLTAANMPLTGALNGETVMDTEYVITDAHAKDHTLLMNALPLKVEGHVYGAVLAQVDITERKHKEAELRKLNRVLKAHNDSEHAMLHAKDEQDFLDKICRVIAEDCGYPFVWIGLAEQDEAKSVRAVAQAGFEAGYLAALNLSWADNAQGRGPTGTAIRTGKASSCRNMLTDPAFAPWRNEALKRGYASSLVLPLLAGNQAFGALTIYSRTPDDFGDEQVRLLTGLSEDLAYGMRTLRLRAANKLSEEDVQRLAHIGVWEMDAATRMLTWSKEVYRIYEVDPEKFATTEKAFMHAVHPEDREMVAAAYSESVRNRAVFDVTHRLLMADARIKYVQERCEHFYDQEGRPVRSVGTVHDITRQKETEAVLTAAQAELARAKRLSDIGTLAATVAHELRNPLATIGMAASNIKRKAKNRDLDRHLSNIDLKVFESNQIINNLLFYSRLRPPHYELVNIHELLEESIRAARGNLKEGVRLVSDIAGVRDVLVEADPIQIKEVLNNLLNNAVDAIAVGAGKVEVSGARKGGCVFIMMKDSGEGMDEETLAHAFDPFFTTKAKGTGLGLSVCRQIMDFHKGEITLKSEPGGGTEAHLRLPEKRKTAAAGHRGKEK